MTTSDGMRIFHRSLTFLLVVAMHEVLPEARVLVDFSVTLGGFFCTVAGRDPLTEDELREVERRMREIVAADEPIVRERMPVEEARAMFAAQGYESKARLFQFAEEDRVTVYSLRGVRDYFYGYMMPSTGEMSTFALQHVPPGFVLRLPRRQDPHHLTAHRDYPKLTRVFHEYRRWLDILGVSDVGALNEVVENGQQRQTICARPARENISDMPTTSCGTGAYPLWSYGGARRPRQSDFFGGWPSIDGGGLRLALGWTTICRPRRDAPDEKGSTISRPGGHQPGISRTISCWTSGRQERAPGAARFPTGRSLLGDEVAWRIPRHRRASTVNPALVDRLPTSGVSHLCLGADPQYRPPPNRIPTTDAPSCGGWCHAQYRGYSAAGPSSAGERPPGRRYIFLPGERRRDVQLGAGVRVGGAKPFAEPLLLRVPRGTMEYVEARRLLAFLRWVRPCTPEFVPDNSLLREFIGGSILRDFMF